MAEEQKVVVDGVEYTLDQITETAAHCLNQIRSLDQKIHSASMNMEQMQVGRDAYIAKLKQELPEPEAAVQ